MCSFLLIEYHNSFHLMFGLPWITLVRFVVWLVIGLVICFLYSQHSSRLQEVEY